MFWLHQHISTYNIAIIFVVSVLYPHQVVLGVPLLNSRVHDVLLFLPTPRAPNGPEPVETSNVSVVWLSTNLRPVVDRNRLSHNGCLQSKSIKSMFGVLSTKSKNQIYWDFTICIFFWGLL
jgi:hypothetical protein